MKLAFLLVLLAGCSMPTLNSGRQPNAACSDQRRCCGCAGMAACGKNADGTTCCKPDDCRCSQVTQR